MKKATGIVRNVDELGRIVIPVELRRMLGVEVTDPIEVYTTEEQIILKKYEPACLFCHDSGEMTYFKGKLVCRTCLSDISNTGGQSA